MLNAHPNFHDRESPSLEARIDITSKEVPKLAAMAAAKAIAEWGHPATDITHIVFSSFSCAGAPSADFHLASLLGLRASVSRTTLNLHGCAGAAKALHLAKDISENNRGARVLVACSEITLIGYCRPTEGCFDSILAHGLFGDGAGAVIVGAGPLTGPERHLFETVYATQTTIPMTEHAISMQFMESGMGYHIGKQLPALVERNIEEYLLDAIRPLGIDAQWNDLFWAVHPGGRAILDSIDAAFALEPGKLAASRHVLSEYGNMTSATLVFVLDEMRRRLKANKDREEVDQWGVMVAFGPGITVEMMVLRAASSCSKNY